MYGTLKLRVEGSKCVNSRKVATLTEIFEHFDQESDTRPPTDTLQ